MKVGQFYRMEYVDVVCMIASITVMDDGVGTAISMLIVESSTSLYYVGECVDYWSPDGFIRVKRPKWEARGRLGVDPASYPIGNFLQIDMPEYGPLTCMITSKPSAGGAMELVVVESIHPNFPLCSTVMETELTEYRKVKRPKWKDKK